MKHILTSLFTALMLMFALGQAQAAALPGASQSSIDQLNAPLICAEEKKKKEGESDEEPECD